MSTRAGIIIKDNFSESHFYRHSDGYPEGIMPTLEKFMSWVKDEKIRNNVVQAAGWLVLLGAEEYSSSRLGENICEPGDDWKCGAYEPTENVDKHGDLEFIYTLDIEELTIECKGLCNGTDSFINNV